MALGPDRMVLSSVVIVSVVLLSVLAGGEHVGVGDGTATVTVVSPTGDRLPQEPGRFGTAASYVRLPELVVDVDSVTGRPRLVYRVSVPQLKLNRQRSRLIRQAGGLKIHLPDRAYPPGPARGEGLPDPGTYDGRLVVRVQSFSADRTIINRTVSVRVTG